MSDAFSEVTSIYYGRRAGGVGGPVEGVSHAKEGTGSGRDTNDA